MTTDTPAGGGKERSAGVGPSDFCFRCNHCLSQWLSTVLGQHGRGQSSGSGELGKHGAAARVTAST